MNSLNQARLKKLLAEKWKRSGEIKTLAEIVAQGIGKHSRVRTMAEHKKNGCYAEIKPKNEYFVDFPDSFLQIPKLVFDSLTF